MAIQSIFHGISTACGAKPAVSGRFGTPGLSGVSDFATQPDGKRRWGTSLKKLAMAIALTSRLRTPCSGEEAGHFGQ